MALPSANSSKPLANLLPCGFKYIGAGYSRPLKSMLNELQIVVAKAAANATLKWISQYENICDYYFEGFTLRRK